jgi:predicted hotdog family 3-hydroxylacyl-ACP dehydratase
VKPIYSVADMVPHSGKMSLLDNIVDYGDDWLQAEVHIEPDAMFADANGVPAWIGLEYMAQAISAWAGLQERLNGGTPKIGLLLGSRKYICSEDYFELGQTLLIKVHLEMSAENGLDIFNCELRGESIKASAVVKVFQPDDAEQFLKDAVL